MVFPLARTSGPENGADVPVMGPRGDTATDAAAACSKPCGGYLEWLRGGAWLTAGGLLLLLLLLSSPLMNFLDCCAEAIHSAAKSKMGCEDPPEAAVAGSWLHDEVTHFQSQGGRRFSLWRGIGWNLIEMAIDSKDVH